MRKIPKTIQSLIIWVIVAALFIGAYYAFFSFFDKKNESVGELLNSIEQSTQTDQRARDLQNFYTSIEEESAEIESLFLQKKQVIEFLQVVEGLGGVTGANVEVKSIKDVYATEDKEQEFLLYLDFNIVTDGSWRSVYHFFILLQNMPYDVTMKQVKLEMLGSDEAGDTWSGIFNFTITAT